MEWVEVYEEGVGYTQLSEVWITQSELYENKNMAVNIFLPTRKIGNTENKLGSNETLSVGKHL